MSPQLHATIREIGIPCLDAIQGVLDPQGVCHEYLLLHAPLLPLPPSLSSPAI